MYACRDEDALRLGRGTCGFLIPEKKRKKGRKRKKEKNKKAGRQA
jgi:hypothetical protein